MGGAGVGEASRDMGAGLNILTLMVTGFAVFYYAGTMVGGGGQLVPVVSGLIGMVGAMMVEVVLLMIRERKGQSAGEVARNERKERERERDAQRRLRVKEEEMRRLMTEMQRPAVGNADPQQQQRTAAAESRRALGEEKEAVDAVEEEPQSAVAEESVRRRKGKSAKL